MEIKVETININDLKVNVKNARTFTEKNKEELKASMENYNLTEPLLINTKNNRVISGHQRLAMMKELNKKDNRFNELYLIKKGDYGYVMDKNDSKIKNDEQELSIGLTSNKIDGSWNYDVLEELFNNELNNTNFFTGFNDEEINVLLKDLEKEVEIIDTEIPSDLEEIIEPEPVTELETNPAPVKDFVNSNKKEFEPILNKPDIKNSNPIFDPFKDSNIENTPPSDIYSQPKTKLEEGYEENFEKYKEYQKNRATLLHRHKHDNFLNETGLLKHLIYPISVLDMKKDFWRKRTKDLKILIGDFTESREGLIKELGTSLTDPFLVYLLLTWFTPTDEPSKVLDMFAGDSVTGWISSKLGHEFTGIELRQEQVDLNNNRLEDNNLNSKSKYICDTGENVLKHVKKESQDFIISCPPYYDLEVYSDLENDASNQKSYEDYLKIIDKALSDSIKCLKRNRFGAIIISDVRDEAGFYRGLPDDFRRIIRKNFCGIYNQVILSEPVGTIIKRLNKAFANRKMPRNHQEIIIFYKGNPNEIQDEFKEVEHKIFEILD